MTTVDVIYLGDAGRVLRTLAAADDVTVCQVSTPTTALERIEDAAFDCLLCEYPDAGRDGIDAFLRRVHERDGLPVVVRAADPSAELGDVPCDRVLPTGGGCEEAGNGEGDRSDGATLVEALRAYADRSRRPVPADGSREAADGGSSRVPLPDATPGAFDDPLLDSLGDLLFVAGPDGNLLRWNERLPAVTGYTDREIAEMGPLDFFPERESETVLDCLARIADGEEVTETVHLLTSDGEEIPYEITSALVGEDEAVLCGVGRDITKRRRTEAKLDEAIAELERSNAELEQFAYVASHDMKQPLRMVSSYLDLLERRYADELDEDAREFIGFASDGAERMREMIDGLLAYSRVGRRDREHEPTDLREALDTALTNLEISIEESEAEIVVEPLPRVKGDPGQLAQLFQNLVGNAIKYSEDTPRIEIRTEEVGDRWAVSVADEGMGIPEDRRERVFDIFSHGEEAGGSGIGLAICEKIVDRHGGDIRVESEVGEGSTFTFTFPKLDEQRSEPAETVESS